MSKKIVTYLLSLLIGIGVFFGNIEGVGTISGDYNIFSVESVHAQDATGMGQPAPGTETKIDFKNTNGTQSSESAKLFNTLIDGLNAILGIVTVLTTPLIMFAGWLMSPDWTSGDLFGIRKPMYSLWVTVSNIVYFIYAILLILIALGTMFNQEKFGYKVMLPKLALGILMVPFTWWFVQWTISIASVVTASVITIPAETITKTAPESADSWWMKPSIPKKIVIDEMSKSVPQQANGQQNTPAQDKAQKCSGGCMSPKDFLTNSAGMYGYMVVYAYSIFNFTEVKALETNTDMLKAGVDIFHQGFVATIMFIVFGLLTLALCAMLLVRAIKLWVYAIFSPLFTFRFVAGSNLIGGDKSDSFDLKEFIGLAFVPAIVGLALSFGLIMISAVSSGNPNNTSGGNNKCTEEKMQPGGEGCTIVSIMGNPNNKINRKVVTEGTTNRSLTTVSFGGIDFEFKGKAGTNTKASEEASSVNKATSVLDSLSGIFGTLIVDVIALVFIWMAFMAAKNVSKAVSAAVQPFEDIGNKIGGLAKSLPKYTPLPIPGGSIRGMERAAQGLASIPEVKSSKDFDNSKIGQWIKNQTGGPSAQEVNNIKNAIEKGGREGVQQMQNIANQIRATGSGESLYSTQQKENLNLLAEKVKSKAITEYDLKEIYGTITGKILYDKLSDGKIDSDEEAKIIAALIATKKGEDTRNITNVTSAEKYLKNGSSNSQDSKDGGDKSNVMININSQNIDIPASQKSTDGKITNGAVMARSITDKIGRGVIKKSDLEAALTGKNLDKDTIKSILDNIPKDYYAS